MEACPIIHPGARNHTIHHRTSFVARPGARQYNQQHLSIIHPGIINVTSSTSPSPALEGDNVTSNSRVSFALERADGKSSSRVCMQPADTAITEHITHRYASWHRSYGACPAAASSRAHPGVCSGAYLRDCPSTPWASSEIYDQALMQFTSITRKCALLADFG